MVHLTEPNLHTNNGAKMTNIIIHTETGHVYITPTGFLVYAKNYYTAAINWQSDGNYSPVPYFLFSRSIELGLKAFLLAKGEKIHVVKSKKIIGHNLIFALRKAEFYSLSEFEHTTTEEEKELQKANAYYNEKGFEYFDIKNLFHKKDMPDLKILQQYSEKLLRDITQFILSST